MYAVQVNKLCDLQSEGDSITSVSWSEDVSMMSCDIIHIVCNVLYAINVLCCVCLSDVPCLFIYNKPQQL